MANFCMSCRHDGKPESWMKRDDYSAVLERDRSARHSQMSTAKATRPLVLLISMRSAASDDSFQSGGVETAG